jgi:hypothetical protein
MLLFRSEEHVARWCRVWKIPRGAIFSIRVGQRLAKAWYGDRLSRNWQPFSPQQAQAVLNKVGLRSNFWRLQSRGAAISRGAALLRPSSAKSIREES